MNIAICGSMQFAKEMIELKQKLEMAGHAIELPNDADKYAAGLKLAEHKWDKIEGDLIRNYFHKIELADAVLIVNITKKEIENYIGGNGLLEMGFAHVLHKTIYLLNPIPEMNYSDEIESMKPIVLNGDLKMIAFDHESRYSSLSGKRALLASRDFSVPRVGIGVMIFKEGKILLGKRKGAHGAGEYAFPGGSLEMMESYEECVRRETLEECGIQVENIRFQLTANSFHFEPRHYIKIGFLADWKSGEPIVLEPDKCESWDWYELNALPSPLFVYTRLLIQSFQTGVTCIDADGSGF